VRKRFLIATFLLWVVYAFWGTGFGREAKKPFAKSAADAPSNDALPRLQRQSATQMPTTRGDDQRAASKVGVKKLPLLDQARFRAEEFMDELPNFIVTQVVTRFVRTSENNNWKRQDKLEVELTYRTNTAEQFKLLRYNDKPTRLTYEQLEGATSAGEFGSMLGVLFAPESKTDFKEVRRKTFRGRRAVIYGFRIKKAFSVNQITDRVSGRTITTGYSGNIWIDMETGHTLRIEQSAEDIQAGFPITKSESAVEYDWVTISGRDCFLPVKAEILIGSNYGRYFFRNVIELRNYRMFDTDLKILPEK
jgi:hypothetical protein